MRCSNCKIAFYCSKDCQIAHHPIHKGECKTIKKAVDVIAKAEKSLRAEFKREHVDPFVDMEGEFWGFHETRPYMRARFAFRSTGES